MAVDAPGQTREADGAWQPVRPQLSVVRLLIAWIVGAASVYVAAAIVPGFTLDEVGSAFLVAAVVAVLNAILPPVVAALRLPAMLVLGFLLVLAVDALALMLADDLLPGFGSVDSFWNALLAALVMAAVSMVLQVFLGTNENDEYTLRVVRRVARRQGAVAVNDVPGIVFLEIDGLALPILRRAMRDGSAPVMARWMEENGYRLTEWETDLSSQTGASQAGILLGSNEDIPAFRWVEKESATMMVCSSPQDCAEIERRHSTGIGLLADGGASRGNLLSGEAEETILTVSRMEAEKRANPGYRAFLANGSNVTQALVLFVWEVLLEWTAAVQGARRDVRPRGHRGGSYPFLRAALCVIVRDAIVFGVLTDMMRGRPAVYATFSSYDEVAHHSGLERADTMEALRKLDQKFGAIERARRSAPRPYEIVVLSDHGQTQGATFKQRNGYGLDQLVERSLAGGDVAAYTGGDEQNAMVGHAVNEATGSKPKKLAKNDVSDRHVLVLGSGNLGLIYLMEERRAPHPRGNRRAAPAANPRAARAPTRRLAARALRRARRAGARAFRGSSPRRRPARGRRSARRVLPDRSRASLAHRRVPPRRGHHGGQLLRSRARRGLRVRGADLLPRRPRRAPDPALHPAPQIAGGPGRADRRRRRGSRSALALAKLAQLARIRAFSAANSSSVSTPCCFRSARSFNLSSRLSGRSRSGRGWRGGGLLRRRFLRRPALALPAADSVRDRRSGSCDHGGPGHSTKQTRHG